MSPSVVSLLAVDEGVVHRTSIAQVGGSIWSGLATERRSLEMSAAKQLSGAPGLSGELEYGRRWHLVQGKKVVAVAGGTDVALRGRGKPPAGASPPADIAGSTWGVGVDLLEGVFTS